MRMVHEYETGALDWDMTIEMVGALQITWCEEFEILEMPVADVMLVMVTRLVSGGLKIERMPTTPNGTHCSSRKGF